MGKLYNINYKCLIPYAESWQLTSGHPFFLPPVSAPPAFHPRQGSYLNLGILRIAMVARKVLGQEVLGKEVLGTTIS